MADWSDFAEQYRKFRDELDTSKRDMERLNEVRKELAKLSELAKTDDIPF